MLTLGIIIGVVGVVLTIVFSRPGSALVFASLVVACIWDEHITQTEWWIFWIAFFIALAYTWQRRWWTGPRTWAGAAMLLLTIVLTTTWSFGNTEWWSNWWWLVAIIAAILLAILLWRLAGVVIAVVAAGIILAAIGAVAFIIGNWGGNDSPSAVPTPAPTVTVTAPPTGSGTPTGAACPAAYVQAFDANKAYRFYSNGVKTSKEDLAYLGHDARTLAFRAFALHLQTSPKPDKLLEPGSKCLSREGQDIYQQVKGALTGVGTKVDNNGEAPATGYNTGMVNGTAVVDSTPGVRGDRTAIVYTLRDGSKLYVMHRCGNIVLPAPPKNVPKGPTDNPKPPMKCVPPKPFGTPPKCYGAKDPSHDVLVNPAVPPVVKGTAPPTNPVYKQPTKPQEPPATYKPPPAPTATSVPNSTPRPSPTPSAPPTTVDPEPSHTSAPPPPPGW